MNQEIDVLGLHLAQDGSGRRCVAVNLREQRARRAFIRP